MRNTSCRIQTLIGLFFALLLTGSANAQYFDIQGENIYEKLICLNQQWAKQATDLTILQEDKTFSNDQEIIQLHLQLVEQQLRKANTTHLSDAQLAERNRILDFLSTYWKAGEFPQNTRHELRIPYFIDEFNTACAVGHLIQASGHEELAAHIAETSNYAYIHDMQYPELFAWADQSGFSVDELAWIQPAYMPTAVVTPDRIDLINNGETTELDVFSNDLIISNFGMELTPLTTDVISSINVALAPQNGEASFDANFLLTYQPNEDFNGIDELIYEIATTGGITMSGKVFIGVHSEAIEVMDDFDTGNFDVTKEYDVLANDTYSEEDIEQINISIHTPEFYPPDYLFVTEENQISYTPFIPMMSLYLPPIHEIIYSITHPEEGTSIGILSIDVDMVVIEPPVVDTYVICEGESIEIGFEDMVPNTIYNWSPSIGLSCTTCPNPIASPMITTNYELSILSTFDPPGTTPTIEVYEIIVEPCVEDCIDESLINPDLPCPAVIAPVCGCDGITYENDCYATILGGVTEWTDGPCGLIDECIDPAMIDPEYGCPENWDPVCGCDGNTYGNECEAMYYGGVTEWTAGECGSSGDCVDQSLIDPTMPCPLIYLPVCGCNGITYDNECIATFYGGITEFTEGPCGPVDECVDPSLLNPNAGCDAVWEPVCGCDGNTYGNECEAINYGGLTEWTMGECGGTGECIDENLIDPTILCITVIEPVCGCDGVTYNNECEAMYFFGVTEWTPGECGGTGDCIDPALIDPMANCIDIYDPVCGCDGVTYGNSCEATFFYGVTEFVSGECGEGPGGCIDESLINPDIACPGVWEPVCGCDGNTYGNECEATYFGGITDFVPGECGSNECTDPSIIDESIECSEVLEPVCGCDNVTYVNECIAVNYNGIVDFVPGYCPGDGPDLIAEDDEIMSSQEEAVEGNLLDNDTFTGDLTINIIQPPVGGTISIDENGDYTFAPLPGFVGTDTFTYEICDEWGSCDTATVIIVVNPPDVEMNLLPDNFEVNADEPTSLNVLANDEITNNSSLDIIITITEPSSGTATVDDDNNIVYTPEEGFEGEVNLEYTICVGSVCESTTITINVIGSSSIGSWANDLMVYPNPTTHSLFVEGEGVLSLSLVDVMGRTILTQAVRADKTNLDVSLLSSGLYLLVVETKQGFVSKKISVN